MDGLEAYLAEHANESKNARGVHVGAVQRYYAAQLSRFWPRNVQVHRDILVEAAPDRFLGRFSFASASDLPAVLRVHESRRHPRYYREKTFAACRHLEDHFEIPVMIAYMVGFEYLAETRQYKIRERKWRVTPQNQALLARREVVLISAR